MVMKAMIESDLQSDARIIGAGEFKAKCLQLMAEVSTTGRAVTVTKRGKPVGQFVPMPAQATLFRSIVGRSPGINVPANFPQLRAALAADWADPAENWARAHRDGKRKKR